MQKNVLFLNRAVKTHNKKIHCIVLYAPKSKLFHKYLNIYLTETRIKHLQSACMDCKACFLLNEGFSHTSKCSIKDSGEKSRSPDQALSCCT